MTYIGTTIAILGFVLFWFDLMTGILTLVIGLSLVWVNEDQRIKKKLQKKEISEEIEKEFDTIKFDEPLSPRAFELATLVYGSIDPYKTWLLKMISDLEKSFKENSSKTIDEFIYNEHFQFKNLFVEAKKYKDICEFLNIDHDNQIFDEIKKTEKNEDISINEIKISEILNDYDLEQWAKSSIKTLHEKKISPNEIINHLKNNISDELKDNLSISFSNGEFVINKKIKISIN